jgi:hypothetical protein
MRGKIGSNRKVVGGSKPQNMKIYANILKNVD